MINVHYIVCCTYPFEEKLYDKKCIYFWSVLLRSIQNSFGLDCMRERMDNCNARAAYFNYQSRHAGSVIQAYSVSQLGSDLRAMNLSNYSGTRVRKLSYRLLKTL